MLKSKILLSITIICSIIILNSCSNEDNSIIEESQVITDVNLELLKANALSMYNSNDFSKIIKPSPGNVDYEGIIEVLNDTRNPNIISFRDYKNVLGKHYDEEYFNQLQGLFEYSINIVQSDLFNKNSTIYERESYLTEVLEFVIIDDLENSVATRSNCQAHLQVCQAGAEDTLGIAIAGCTAGAVVAAIFSGGAGAAAWPVCMAFAGLTYDSNMATCQAHYQVCIQL